MSFTLYALIAAAAPAALEAIGDFARENRGAINTLLKQSKPAIHEASKTLDSKLNEEVHKYENNGWDKDKKG